MREIKLDPDQPLQLLEQIIVAAESMCTGVAQMFQKGLRLRLQQPALDPDRQELSSLI